MLNMAERTSGQEELHAGRVEHMLVCWEGLRSAQAPSPGKRKELKKGWMK